MSKSPPKSRDEAGKLSEKDSSTDFWQEPLGQRIARIERVLMARALSRLHGETVVWIGRDLDSANVLSRKLINLPVYIDLAEDHGLTTADEETQQGRLAPLRADIAELPFQTGTVDGIVLHHALEELSDPRRVLREMSRVLAPGGKIIIAGVNPWSLLGVRWLWGLMSGRFNQDAMSNRRLINPIRLFDWLTLLGLELDARPLYGAPGLIRNRAPGNEVTPEGTTTPFGTLVVVSAIKPAVNGAFRWQSSRKVQVPGGSGVVTYPQVPHWGVDRRGSDDGAHR